MSCLRGGRKNPLRRHALPPRHWLESIGASPGVHAGRISAAHPPCRLGGCACSAALSTLLASWLPIALLGAPRNAARRGGKGDVFEGEARVVARSASGEHRRGAGVPSGT